MGQQRQHPRVVRPARAVGADLPDDQLRQPRFELQPHGLGRPGHRFPQLRGGQRAEHHVPVLQRVGQLRIAEALLVEVGADAEDDEDGGVGSAGSAGGRGRGVEDLDEGAPDRLVGAEGERLLELVHDDDGPRGGPGLAVRPGGDGLPGGVGELGRTGLWSDGGARRGGPRREGPFCGGAVRGTLLPGDEVGELGDPERQLPQGISSWHELEDLPGPAVPVRGAAPQRGHQSGVQQGRLTRPRGADEHHQAPGFLRRAQQGDEGVRAPLPPEEPPGVLRTVRGQTPVGAHTTGNGRGFGRSPLLPPLFRRRLGRVRRRVRDRALPQALPLGQVVQARGHGGGLRAPCLGDQDVQHRREGGELGGHVLGPPPVADPLSGDPHGAPSFVDPLKPDDRLGHALERRVTGFLVQQRETFREGRACTRAGTQGLHSPLPLTVPVPASYLSSGPENPLYPADLRLSHRIGTGTSSGRATAGRITTQERTTRAAPEQAISSRSERQHDAA